MCQIVLLRDRNGLVPDLFLSSSDYLELTFFYRDALIIDYKPNQHYDILLSWDSLDTVSIPLEFSLVDRGILDFGSVSLSVFPLET